MQIKKAQRSQVKLKMGISGQSGAGKTKAALRIAYGITNDWSKILFIDTENKSASLYANCGDIGEFDVLDLAPPFSPQRFVEAIKLCDPSKYEVLIIDTASAEWDGPGGALEINSSMSGSSYMNWQKTGEMHKKFLDAFLQHPVHVIITLREKTEYVIEKNDKGKDAPKKVGTKEIQRDGLEYELSVAFKLQRNHLATCDKDRTELFSDLPPFELNAGTGKTLKAWAENGEQYIKPPEVYSGTPDQKKQVKQALVSCGIANPEKEEMIKLHDRMMGKTISEFFDVAMALVSELQKESFQEQT